MIKYLTGIIKKTSNIEGVIFAIDMVFLVSMTEEHTILYVQNIMKKKQAKKTVKKQEKKTILNYFEEISFKKPTSDTKGRGQVKGLDIDRINDYLDNK